MSEAQLIDFDAARRRLRPGDVYPINANEKYAEVRRRCLLAEALALPKPWHRIALAEAERWSTVDDYRSEDTLKLKAHEAKHGGRLCRYATSVPNCVDELRVAIENLREAERTDRASLPYKRRVLTMAKRRLLQLLFRYGRRRIDWVEIDED